MKNEIQKKSKELLNLNELYHKYLYVKSIESKENELKRLNTYFN